MEHASEPNKVKLSLGNDKVLTRDIFTAKIIIAEDMAFMRDIIGKILNNAGYNNLHFASDGKEALELVDKIEPDLIILDLNMPLVSGYEVCETVRKSEKNKDIPILVQSMLESAKDRNVAFEAGATDFVTKPINAPELLARTSIHLENKMLISELSEYNKRVSIELETARHMQMSIIPDEDYLDRILNKYNLKIKSFVKASSELAGDVWGLKELSESSLGFYILDVSGHGIGAALNTFRIHQVIGNSWQNDLDPAGFITRVNDQVSENMKTGQFATMFCGIIDIENGKLNYASAAQPSPFIIDNQSRSNISVTRCPSSGPIVGHMANMKYENKTIDFKPGNEFFIYSDALIETKNANGDMMGEKGLEQLLNSIKECTNQHDCHDFMLSHFNKQYANNLNDDLTILNISSLGD